MKVVKACLPKNWPLVASIMATGFSLAAFLCSINPEYFSIEHFEIFLINIFLAPLFSFILGLHTPSAVEVSEMNENESKNLADGLAWSYYFGYLKLILPQLAATINNTATEVGGVAVRDHMPTKLFIIIPKNCYCYDNFADVDSRITFIDSSATLEINRAGVQRRVYKNSIYKISLQANEVFYCLMEYATPLQSLYDMGTHVNGGLTAENRDEQVVLFYKKLKEILDGDKECRGKYHMILTSDAGNQLADTVAREIKSERISMSVDS